MIQKPSPIRMIDSKGGAFGFDCCLASPKFRVFQQPARKPAGAFPFRSLPDQASVIIHRASGHGTAAQGRRRTHLPIPLRNVQPIFTTPALFGPAIIGSTSATDRPLGTPRALVRYPGDGRNRGPARQFASKAARCKARAAFELRPKENPARSGAEVVLLEKVGGPVERNRLCRIVDIGT